MQSTFARLLTHTILNRKYGNAQQDDLWQHLTDQAHQDFILPEDMNVKSIMDTWTLQMGFPLITITRNYSDSTASVSQVLAKIFSSIV